MSAIPADLSLSARWILPMSAHAQLLEQHAIIVRGGRIVEVLPQGEAQHRYAPAAIVDRPSHVLMPGLVNAHTQAAMSLLRGFADGWPRGVWPGERLWPSQQRFLCAEFVRDSVSAAVADMLKSGITCFGDMHFFPEETARTAVAQGIRAVIGMPVADFASPWAETSAQYLTRALSLRDEYKGHPRIATAFAPHAPAAVSDETFARIATLADELDSPVFVPVHESTAEIGASLARHGLRPIERLAAFGLLTPALNAIHMTHANASDIELARRGGVSVSLCPGSNLKHGNGPPPLGALAAAGLRLGLGSDAPAAHTDQDLWSEIRLSALLPRIANGAATAHEPWDALAAATRGGAAALGLDAEIGSLEPGKWADLCCVDLSGPSTQPACDPVTQLVFCGGRDMVTDVWVAGRQLLADSQLTRLDWPAVSARAGVWTTRLHAQGRDP